VNAPDRREVMKVIEGCWGKLSDERSAAYDEWLSHAPVTEDQMKLAVTSVWEAGEYRFAPQPAAFMAELRSRGVLGEPVPGTQDPRTINRLVPTVQIVARNIARLRGLSFREALAVTGQTYRQHADDFASDGAEGANTWLDLFATVEHLLENQREEATT
jgi:hypothetical protein